MTQLKQGSDKYRQMSGGKFLAGLKDVIWSKRILKIKSLVKESIDVKVDIKVTENEDAIQQEILIIQWK